VLCAAKTRPRQSVWKIVQVSACPKCSPALVSRCVGRTAPNNGYAIARRSMRSCALSNDEGIITLESLSRAKDTHRNTSKCDRTMVSRRKYRLRRSWPDNLVGSDASLVHVWCDSSSVSNSVSLSNGVEAPVLDGVDNGSENARERDRICACPREGDAVTWPLDSGED
jgi:hypothetical protein